MCAPPAPPTSRTRVATRRRSVPPSAGVGKGTNFLDESSDLEQAPRIAVEHLLLVLGAQGHGVHPLHPRQVLDKRPVDREKNALDAQLEQCAQQRRGREVAAGGDLEVTDEGCL